ncbi:MAG TPA: PKD domain-containing protein [Thermoplasmatales archaeon]|nr:PKD domain-containing protein [Thermoplasmatales archaeon]
MVERIVRNIFIFCTVLFLLFANNVSSKSVDIHMIIGYVYYEGSTVVDVNLTIINEDKGEKIYKKTDKYGFYSFNTGSFHGPGWNVEDKLKILANGTGDNMGLQGTATTIINEAPYQWLNITLSSRFILNFSYSPQNPTDLDEINFFADLNENIVSWEWQFGDGSISHEKNPNHKYSDDGNYLVNLTVKDNEGFSYRVSRSIYVSNVLPHVDFSWNPLRPTINDYIQFMDNSSDEDGYIVNYTWNFGDGNISHEKNPVHKYNKNGIYNVTLTVVDDDLEKKSISNFVEIVNLPPVSIFYYFINNLTLKVDASLSYDLDGEIVKYEWRWNEKDVWHSGEKIEKHEYSKEGNYTVYLRVSDDYDSSNTTSVNIQVKMGTSNMAPKADFIFEPGLPTDIDYIQFMDNSSDEDGYIVNYTWNFGDGNISHEKNPVHKYNKNGVYNVELYVKDNKNATSLIKKVVVVLNVLPHVDFSWNPLRPTINDYIQFMDNSSDEDGYIVNYTWNFGDGNISHEKNPVHKYGKQGVYRVQLTIMDDDGFIKEKSLMIKISEKKETPSFQIILFLMALILTILLRRL